MCLDCGSSSAGSPQHTPLTPVGRNSDNISSWFSLTPKRKICADNLAVLDGFFSGPAGKAYFSGWAPPPGTSVAFPLVKGTEGAEAFCKRVLDETGILLLPGGKFLAGTADCERRVRFGFGRSDLPEVRARGAAKRARPADSAIIRGQRALRRGSNCRRARLFHRPAGGCDAGELPAEGNAGEEEAAGAGGEAGWQVGVLVKRRELTARRWQWLRRCWWWSLPPSSDGH